MKSDEKNVDDELIISLIVFVVGAFQSYVYYKHIFISDFARYHHPEIDYLKPMGFILGVFYIIWSLLFLLRKRCKEYSLYRAIVSFIILPLHLLVHFYVGWLLLFKQGVFQFNITVFKLSGLITPFYLLFLALKIDIPIYKERVDEYQKSAKLIKCNKQRFENEF